MSKTAVFGRTGAMFSNLWSVTGFLAWAEKNDITPVLDFETHQPANRLVDTPGANAWNDYFEPVSGISAEEARALPETIEFTDRPQEFPVHEYSQVPRYGETFRANIRLNPFMSDYVASWRSFLPQAGALLGVHARGTDMRVAKSHQAPPEVHQLTAMLDEALERAAFDHIFVATEDTASLRQLSKRYGSMVVTTDSFRTDRKSKLVNQESSVVQWRYVLGMQVIRDAWLLGACKGLVSGSSNVSEHAQVISEKPFEVNLQIRRPRVDLLGSGKTMIRFTNAARYLTTSRVRGLDFKVLDRSVSR